MTHEQIEYVLSNYLFEMLLGLFGLILILFIIIVIQGVLISGMKAFYKGIYSKKKDNNSIELNDIVINNKIDLDIIKSKNNLLTEEIQTIQKKLVTKLSKHAIHKYDAYETIAGQLSFVYVLLNDENTGFILNGIHSNEGHYLYLKEVSNGQSKALLSREETETLKKAING